MTTMMHKTLTENNELNFTDNVIYYNNGLNEAQQFIYYKAEVKLS